jgi:hypothetical protein
MGEQDNMRKTRSIVFCYAKYDSKISVSRKKNFCPSKTLSGNPICSSAYMLHAISISPGSFLESPSRFYWWLMPVTLATQEAKIRRIIVGSQQGGNSSHWKKKKL